MFYNYEVAKKLLYNSRNKDPVLAADNIIKKNEFLLPPFGRVIIDVHNNFKTKQTSRSFWRLVHGLTFLGDLYISYNRTQNIKYLNKGKELINLWFQFRNYKVEDKMIFHDETTALRLSYLLNFYYISYNILDSTFITKLTKEINETVDLLLDENFHSTNTNHGMFQDMALLSYSILTSETPKRTVVYNTAIKRLLNYFLSCFTKDGVHKEHSPDYHYMVSNNVKKIYEIILSLGDDLSNSEKELIKIFESTETYSMYIVQPDLKLPKISDCSGLYLPDNRTYSNMYTSEDFKYLITNGKEGVESSEKQKVFKDAGTFISRTGWNSNDLQFVFLANYNASYHKHTDDLSFTLYDNREIFIDMGPNGYDYKDKYTKYAYSGFAHSTLIENNISLPRNDGKFDKVGIEYAIYEENGSIFEVKGFNRRYENTLHNRTFKGDNVLKEYEITDEIISKDRNQYKLLFQISHDLDIVITHNIVSIFEKDEKIAELELANNNLNSDIEISHIRGRDFPVGGYEFIKMGEKRPSNTLALNFYNSTNASEIKTIIRLKNFKEKSIINNIEKEIINNIKNLNFKEVKEIQIMRSEGKLGMNFNYTDDKYSIVYHLLDKNNKPLKKSKTEKSNKLVLNESEILNKRIKIFLKGEYNSKTFMSPIIRDLNNITINEV